MNWLRRLFCRHKGGNPAFVRNLYGDQIIEWGWKRSVWRCEHCGSLFGRDDLQEKPHG
jgi:hypothetical protein